MNSPTIDDRDWSALTLGEQTRMLEVDGYFVLPDVLSPDHVTRLKEVTAELQTRAVDYSESQRVCSDIQFNGGLLTELIAHPPTIKLLSTLFGGDVIFTHYSYARSEPGHPGVSLHTDGQPYGSKIFGYTGSAPRLVRVLYYLDDLTPDVSPFRVVPRSHLSFHSDANPYLRYESHPEEVMVTLKAGSAVFLNHRVFHGNYPNTGDRSREMLAIGYRPAWSGPVGEVDPWQNEDLETLPVNVRELFRDPNTREWLWEGGNKQANMRSEADGISPGRWNRKA